MNSPASSTRDHGFSLVEVALALGVAAFCMITVFGLVPLGVNTNRMSFEQTGAANIASAVVADLRAVVLTLPPASPDPKTPLYQIAIPGVPAGATAFNTFFVRQDGTLCGPVDTYDAESTQNPHYRVTLYFTSAGTVTSGTVGNPNATTVRVLITWPALADASHSNAPAHYSGAFETLAGLTRN